MNLYNPIDEIVRNLKKELQQPKKQYGEPPGWIPSNQQILTNQSAVRLYYQTFINQENDKFKADGNGEIEYSPITLFGQPPIIPKIEKGPASQPTENHLLRKKWKKAQKKNEGKIETEKVAVKIEIENNFVPDNKPKTKNEFTRKFNCITSELRIKIPMDCHGNEFIARCTKPAHGYCEENAKKAMERFLRRGLFIVEKIRSWESEPQSSHWGRTIKFCHKFVTVPSIPNAVFVEIRGNEGATEEEAEMSCDLIILEELYTFNVIKEAAIELYSQERKGLTDPTRGLDSKLMAWMGSKLTTFLKKMCEIEAETDNFY